MQKPSKRRFKPLLLRVLALAVLALVVALSGCGDSAEREYRDFISEMDILTRFDLCFRDALLNRAGFYTEQELKFIKADLLNWNGNLKEATAANGLFCEAADMLLECIESAKNGKDSGSDKLYDEAMSKYTDAKTHMYAITPEVKNV